MAKWSNAVRNDQLTGYRSILRLCLAKVDGSKASLNLATLALACFFTAGANAADLVPASNVRSADLWTGFHYGVGVGGAYSFSDLATDYEGVEFNEGTGEISPIQYEFSIDAKDIGRNSAFGTVEAGYDWQFSENFVLGVLGNFDFGKSSWTSAGKRFSDFFEGELNDFREQEVQLRRKNAWFIGGRFGWTPNDGSRWLWYGLLGYTQTEIESAGSTISVDSELGGDLQQRKFSTKRGGLTVGGGVETLAFGDNISTKLEYRYTDFGSLNWSTDPIVFGTDCDFCEAYIQNTEFDMREHSVRAVVSWRPGMDNTEVYQNSDTTSVAIATPADRWAGFHIGVGGGGAYNASKITADFVHDEEEILPIAYKYSLGANELRRVNAFGTVEAGYDWQFSENFVLGAFGNFDFSESNWAREKVSETGFQDGEIGNFEEQEIQLRRKNAWFIGGRFGWTPNDGSRWLWYGLLGYTQTEIESTGSNALFIGIIGNPVEDQQRRKFSTKRGGLTVGGGVETLAFGDNISTKLEYRYTDFGSLNWSTGLIAREIDSDVCDISPCRPYIQNTKFDMREHSVRAVVSWRFNSGILD